MKVSVIGLGKLGLPLAAWIGQRHEVYGYDASASWREEVRRWLGREGACPIAEPGMDEARDGSAGPLFHVEDEATVCDVTMIIVPTPSMINGAFDNRHVLTALGGIGTKLSEHCEQVRPTVVLVSTVSPRSCSQVLIPYLEAASGKQNGRDFHFVYSPEFIALGSVMVDLAGPDIVLCGTFGGEDPGTLRSVYGPLNSRFTALPTEWHVMGYTNAEIAKLALNCYVTQKICFANAIGDLCERYRASPEVVLGAVGGDRRVGRAYLRSGTAYGGPCFPRDGAAIIEAARAAGCKAGVLSYLGAPTRLRSWQLEEQVAAIHRHLKPHSRVVVIGASYKPGHPLAEESASLSLVSGLRDLGHDVHVFIGDDPGIVYGLVRCAAALCVMHPGFNLDWPRVVESLAHGALVWAPWGDPSADSMGDAPVFYSRGYIP
jgi:UDPglucose 6-dehydrogenase